MFLLEVDTPFLGSGSLFQAGRFEEDRLSMMHEVHETPRNIHGTYGIKNP